MLSVVIPLYNKAPHIEETLKKVLAQNVSPTEVIVVDDGSTDDGPAIVSRHSTPNVHLIRQNNQGVSAARNLGLKLARAPYVAFLDADDEWLANHTEHLTKLITKHPEAALFSTAHQIRREGRLIEPQLYFEKGWSGLVDDFFKAYSVGLSLVNSSTACVRKESLEAVGGFPVGVRRGEDIVAWVKMALHYSVAHTAVVTSVYNQDTTNRSDQFREAGPPGSLLFMQKLLEHEAVPQERVRSFERLFDRISLMTAAGFSLNGDTQAAKAIAHLAMQAGRFKVAATIALINKLPKSALRTARRWRHKPV